MAQPFSSSDRLLPLAVQEDGVASPDTQRTGRYGATSKATSFESLDYEICDNTVYKAEEANKGPADPLVYRATKYFICALLGLSIAVAAFGVNIGVENIAGTKFWLTFQASKLSFFAGWLTMATVQTGLSVMAVCACLYIGPAAVGSGIPDVIAYLNGVDVVAVFLLRTLVAKLIGSLGSVGGGLAIGKEGPFVHIGACIASLLSQGGAWAAYPSLKWLVRFKNDRERRDFVTCGAAAGVAAAFRAPVGGLLFALEELSSHWSKQLLLTCFFTTAVVNVTMRMIMSVCRRGGCGFFGEGDAIIFHIAETEAQQVYETFELLPMLLVGIVGGLLGSLFNHLNAAITVWRKKHLPRKRHKILDAAAVALLSATVSFVLPLLVSCKKCPEDNANCPRPEHEHSGNFVAFGCAADEYNDLATLFFNTQDDAIRNLFSANTPEEYSMTSLFLFFCSFYLLTIITYGIAVPAGLFVPSVLVGACYGRMIGYFVRSLHPDSVVDESTYALLGAASYMAGSMRLVVAICVMLLELTNQLSLLPLMMLVLVVARAVGDGSGVPGVYDIQMQLKNFPMLGPKPGKILRHVTAADLCSQSPPVTLPRLVRVDHLLSTLRSCNHNGFPVLESHDDGSLPSTHGQGSSAAPGHERPRVNGAPGRSGAGAGTQNGEAPPQTQLLGVILRHHLLVLLKSGRAFQHSPMITHNSQRIAFMYQLADFDKQVSTEPITIQDVEPLLSNHVMAMWIDLKPYVNQHPYVVQQSTCATQTYSLFQTLGLRHLCVVKDTSQVTGVLTRKDFMPGNVNSVIEENVLCSRVQSQSDAHLDVDGAGNAGPSIRQQSNVVLASGEVDPADSASRAPAASRRIARPGHVHMSKV